MQIPLLFRLGIGPPNKRHHRVSGRGTCITEGDTYEIGPGDMVLTRLGDEHSLVVHERMVAVYAYGPLKPGGVFGHLHR
jgi:mannose-6-phosphate isomerase-like protein (cupin superfamily)